MLSSKRAAIVLVCLLGSLTLPSLHGQQTRADRCIVPVKDVDVYGPGQRAIIAWNKGLERLILSTDLYAHTETRILEVLTLPSKPTVEKASFESFRAVQDLMIMKMPRAIATQYMGGLEVVFHEKIGAHDATIVKAISLTELASFMADYLEKNGLDRLIAVGEETRRILGDYVTRGFNYWVFDLVDLYSTTRSLEPLAYQFQSSSMYYPMKVSSVAKGLTEIVLYLIASDPLKESDIPPKMRLGRYAPSDQVVQFQLTPLDLERVDPQLNELFNGRAWFTAVKYSGSLAELDFDLQIVPQPTLCRTITVRVNESTSHVGDTLTIGVDFVHLLPACAEIMVLHFHEIRLEVLDSNGARKQVWEWRTNSDLHQEVLWRPQTEDNYVVRASSWWNGERLEVDARTSVTAAREAFPKEIFWLLGGALVAVSCVLVGAGITYILLKPRVTKRS